MLIVIACLGGLILSCSKEEKKVEQKVKKDSVAVVAEPVKTVKDDYSGLFKLKNVKDSKLIINIIREDEKKYKYSIVGDKKEYSGNITISKEDGKTYLNFSGKIGNNPENSMSALFENDSITIQNYGNSMNKYVYFKDLDAKYLVLAK